MIQNKIKFFNANTFFTLILNDHNGLIYNNI